jgi:hypothetical protein
MSGSNRNERLASVAKYGGALTALLVLLLVVWQISAQITENRTYAERNAHHYAESAHDEIERSCITRTPAEIANCVEQITKASEDSQRAEYDLKAQRDMSEWSFWVLCVSGLGIVFTAVGIWFVRENLIEMQRQRTISESAIKVSKDIGQAQVRAYLTCVGGRYKIDSFGLVCYTSIANNGQSPPKNIEMKAEIIVSLDKREKGSVVPDLLNIKTKANFGGCQIVPSGQEREGLLWFTPDEIGHEGFNAIMNGDTKFTVHMALYWDDVFDVPQRVPIILYQEQMIDQGVSGLPIEREGALTAHNQSHGKGHPP